MLRMNGRVDRLWLPVQAQVVRELGLADVSLTD